MIKLTAPNGTEVDVNSAAITSIYPNDGTYDKRAHTILVVAGQHQAVIETVEQVKALTK